MKSSRISCFWDLVDNREAASAANNDFLVKKWCQKIQPYWENPKYYGKSDSIFWKARKFTLKIKPSVFYQIVISRFKTLFGNAEFSFFLYSWGYIQRWSGSAWKNMKEYACWEANDFKFLTYLEDRFGIRNLIRIYMISECFW